MHKGALNLLSSYFVGNMNIMKGHFIMFGGYVKINTSGILIHTLIQNILKNSSTIEITDFSFGTNR